MSKPNSEIKFAILKASYWVGDATEYGCVYWLLKQKENGLKTLKQPIFSILDRMLNNA
jgi:hypothetical protein